MAQTVCVLLNADETARLEAVVADRNRPLRTRAARQDHPGFDGALAGAGGGEADRGEPAGGMALAGSLRSGRPSMGFCVTRREPPGKAPLTTAKTAKVARVLALTCSEPPGEVTHWTGRAMAQRPWASR